MDTLTGQILIAMPGIGDPRFERAILHVCSHTPEGAMAIALNKPVEGMSTGEVLEKLGFHPHAQGLDQPILVGGPVEPQRGHVLHTDDYAAQGATVIVGEGFALTSTKEVLDAMSDESRRPRRAILVLGYAGWDAEQLEHELVENVWLTCEADEDLLFGQDHNAKWGMALAKIGVDPASLSVFSGTA
ncbi:MAG: YqgE/AlgH family protein [Caulobacteraceae bacterium]